MGGVEEDVDWDLIPDSVFIEIGDRMEELVDGGQQPEEGIQHTANKFKIKDVKPLGSGPTGILNSVRVTSKSRIVNWDNRNGNGQLFNVVLMDETGDIQVTGFNDAVTRFYHLLTVGEVYDLENVCVQRARKEFNKLSHAYEIILCNESVVRAVHKGVTELPPPPVLCLNIVPFCDLESKADGCIVDLLGICSTYKALQTVVARNSNREHDKRDIFLVDDTGREVVCTIWDESARNFSPTTFPLVLCIKGAKVNTYRGQKCIGTTPTSQLIVDPAGCEEAAKLKKWYLTKGYRQIPIKYLSKPLDNSVPSHLVYEIDSDRQSYADGFNFKCVVTVFDIRWDNALFLSCRRCHRKVLSHEDKAAEGGADALEGSMMKCSHCNLVLSMSEVSTRLMLRAKCADISGSIWVKVFQEESESLLGETAASLLLAYSKDKARFSKIVEAVRFERFVLGIFAKRNERHSNSLTYCCTFVSKIDYRALAEELQKNVSL